MAEPINRYTEHVTCQGRAHQQDAGDEEVGGQDADLVHHGAHAQCHHDAAQLLKQNGTEDGGQAER